MRDSNYRAISSNKAAVTITTSLYDRRALDVTSDKPLVNSLNYLTYLVSSSAKVRETLSVDGGIERLIEILHECHSCDRYINDNGDKQVLIAWKWTLAFQCLVLVGTRGTEKIRQKVVRAGILPIIATVLDNYLTLHEQVFLHSTTTQSSHQQSGQQRNTSTDPTQQSDTQVQELFQSFSNQEQSDSFTVHPSALRDGPNEEDLSNATFFPVTNGLYYDQFSTTATALESTATATFSTDNILPAGMTLDNIRHEDVENSSLEHLFQLLRVSSFDDGKQRDGNFEKESYSHSSSIHSEVKRNIVVLNILGRLRETKEADVFEEGFVNDCEFDMDSNLQFLSELYMRDMSINSKTGSKAAVRSFTKTGVVIPKDDDIVWSLQLLAYISKYPYLKEVLQNTHLVLDMSIRDKQLKMYLENQIRLKVKKSLSIKSRPTIRPKSRKPRITYLKKFNPSASNSPQMLTSLNDDSLIPKGDKFALCDSGYAGIEEISHVEISARADDEAVEDEEEVEVEDDEEEENEDDVYNGKENSDGDLEEIFSDSSECTFKDSSERDDLMASLYERVVECESLENDFLRKVKLYQLNEKLSRLVDEESKKLSSAIIKQRLKKREFLERKWDYEKYKYFDIDEYDEDKDDSLREYKRINLFPIVEKFTFLSGTDMYYWSGVIMRNSCRRNDLKGGVRQCGNLDCGKWEKYPREFSKCRRCKRTKYCSRDCQMKAWHCHRNWCIPSSSSSSACNQTTSSVPVHQQNQDDTRGAGRSNTLSDDPGSQAGSEGANEDGQESPHELS
ncbi:samB [Candida margitis]|uniref:samB n=1 Tax=Candida margitis TaxID=1775924 RepID=UPI002225E457|nr:samB [Candida margitis]KAI5961101.1 samB [Candida margitis]